MGDLSSFNVEMGWNCVLRKINIRTHIRSNEWNLGEEFEKLMNVISNCFGMPEYFFSYNTLKNL